MAFARQVKIEGQQMAATVPKQDDKSRPYDYGMGFAERDPGWFIYKSRDDGVMAVLADDDTEMTENVVAAMTQGLNDYFGEAGGL